MKPRAIPRARKPLDGALRVPSSKSVTHRALVAASLAEGESTIVAPLEADDTLRTLAGLEALGVRAERAPGLWRIRGGPRYLAGGATLHLGDSGTSMRFLVALAALGRAGSTLDGSARLRERPVHDLVQALRSLGANVEDERGSLPVRAGGTSPRGGAVHVRADRSSQFASALLLVGPALPRGLRLTLDPPAVSLPYVELTVQVMGAFGIAVERRSELEFGIAHSPYRAREYRVEGDHSSASYFLAAAAIVGGRVRIDGVVPESRQPDARMGALLAAAGCEVVSGPDWIEVLGGAPLRPFDLDVGQAPDLVPTLAVLAMFARGTSRLRNIGHLRDKESDRLAVIADNLSRLRCEARVVDEGLEIRGEPGRLRGATLVTSSDHRMAMAFAVAGLAVDGVVIDDPACVSKSNPGFWEQIDTLVR